MTVIKNIKKSDIDSFVSSELSLTKKQLQYIIGKTPKSFVKTRPGKGGKTWKYIDVSYIIVRLNFMFGWDWNFEILDEKILEDVVIVKGKLSCKTKTGYIIKMQYGRKEIARQKKNNKPLDIGNDLKAAASDSLKKCASMIGIASDIYGNDSIEYKLIDDTEMIKQKNKDEEIKRIKEFIKNATSKSKLIDINNKVYDSHDDNLISIYENKLNELQ